MTDLEIEQMILNLVPAKPTGILNSDAFPRRITDERIRNAWWRLIDQKVLYFDSKLVLKRVKRNKTKRGK